MKKEKAFYIQFLANNNIIIPNWFREESIDTNGYEIALSNCAKIIDYFIENQMLDKKICEGNFPLLMASLYILLNTMLYRNISNELKDANKFISFIKDEAESIYQEILSTGERIRFARLCVKIEKKLAKILKKEITDSQEE